MLIYRSQVLLGTRVLLNWISHALLTLGRHLKPTRRSRFLSTLSTNVNPKISNSANIRSPCFVILDISSALGSHIKLMQKSHFLTLGTHVNLEISNSTSTGWSGCANLVISCSTNMGYSYYANSKISSSICLKYYQSQRLMFSRTVSFGFRQRWCFTTNECPCCASTDCTCMLTTSDDLYFANSKVIY